MAVLLIACKEMATRMKKLLIWTLLLQFYYFRLLSPMDIVLFTRFESIRVHWAPMQYNNYPRNYLYTRIVVYTVKLETLALLNFDES